MRWLSSVLIVTAISGLAAGGRHVLGLPDVEMLYLLGVMLVGLWLGRGPSVLASALSVASYDLLFVPPSGKFTVADARFLLTFVMMFGVGLLVSELTLRLRRQEQAVIARAEEARTAAMRAKTEELRSAILSSVSHDLRTPLATITGAVSTLRDQPELDESTRRDLLDAVSEEAERLERLVGNLLDMTRLESGALVVKREWVPFEEIVGAARARLERQHAGHTVRTALPDDLPLVPCDPVLLEQLLINLLDNAAKYTQAGTEIDIVARTVTRTVEIQVADRGPGIPVDMREHVFERFARGPHGGVAGAGLGLAICRGIARAHGGTLAAEARTGGGAVFHLTLPVLDPPPPAVEAR
jgi:K+-sensing histidine kinase KdpD